MKEAHMKLNKKIMVAAAAGALAVAAAVPAMAIENEFHGSIMFRSFLSNMDSAQNAPAGATSIDPRTWNSTRRTNNYTEQRTRLQYIAKASDDLKLVTQFEIDTIWGQAASGGDVDTDAMNIKVKHAYLDFNLGKSVNVKLGQQSYKDTLKGLYVDADLPMAYVAVKAGKSYKLGLGYSRFNDTGLAIMTNNRYNGKYTADLYVIDNTMTFGKNAKATLSYYLNADNSAQNNSDRKVHTFALGGAAKFGKLTVDGFAAMQAGYRNMNNGSNTNYHGWAANAVAKMPVGPGTVKVGGLFVSGNTHTDQHNNAWQPIGSNGAVASNQTQNSYNDGAMMILTRNTNLVGTNTNAFIRRPITNIALAHAGYDAKVTDKLSAMANVGMAWAPASEANTQASDYMGTEINMMAKYQLYKNLDVRLQAAYMILGSYYKNTSATDATKYPADPFTTSLGIRYAF